MSEWITDRRPTLTKLEYFALIIGAHQHGTYRDLWADNAIERAQLLIAELDKVQGRAAIAKAKGEGV